MRALTDPGRSPDIGQGGTATRKNLLAGGTAPPEALTSGFALAFWVGVGFAALSLLATLVTLRREDLVNADALPMAA